MADNKRSELSEESKYRQLINKMTAGYALHEIICNDKGEPVDYRFLEINPAFEEMTGLRAESVIGHTCLEVLPQTESIWIERFGKVALTGESASFESFSKEINRHFNVTAFRTAPNQFACTFNYIPEQKNTAIFESEENFRSLYSNSPFGIVICSLIRDSKGEVVDFIHKEGNPSIEKQTGFNLNDLVGKKASEIVDNKVLSDLLKMYGNVVSKRETINYTKYFDIYDRTLEVRAYPLHGDMFIINFFDVSIRVKAEEKIKKSETFLQSIINNIGDPIFVKDDQSRLILVNDAFCNIYDLKKSEIIGKTLAEEVPKDEQEHFLRVDKQVLKDGQDNLCEESLTIKGKQTLIISTRKTCFTDNAGKKFIVGAIRDITEKQKLEESMHRSQKLESLGILAGGIAHDFNNILSAIFGYTEMAILKTNDSESSNYLSKSLSNIERARALTQQLLTFSKGGTPVKKVDKLFPFVKKTVKFALSGSSVTSRFNIEKNLWSCDFDKNQIGQVIDNLTINAQQAMPSGGKITIVAQNISLSENEHPSLAQGNYVKLSIKDQGIGIPPEFLPRIFDPYYTTKPKGHGLGLATCYSIVNRHNGSIDVESELGKGSTFKIYLPATDKSISNTEERTAKQHYGNGTILVMDDETAILELMEEMLGSFGYEVISKKNGKEVLEFLKEARKDNILISGMIFDLTIPGGMGGKETVEEVRKFDSQTPVFVASGYSEDPIVASPQDHGFNASIRKPFMIADLSEMLEEHLKKN